METRAEKVTASRDSSRSRLRWIFALCLSITWFGWSIVLYDVALYVGYRAGDVDLPYWPPLSNPVSYSYAVVAIAVPSVLIGLLSILNVLSSSRWPGRIAVLVTALLVPCLLWRVRFGAAIAGLDEFAVVGVVVVACASVFVCGYQLMGDREKTLGAAESSRGELEPEKR